VYNFTQAKTLRGRKDTLAQVYFIGGNRPSRAPGIDSTGSVDVELTAETFTRPF